MSEALMFLMMPWPLSWCFSLLPPDVFLQDDVTAGQNAPQRSLSSQQEAAVRMLFPRPLQQVLEENGEKISRNLPEKLLHCSDYLQISRVVSSALSVFKMLDLRLTCGVTLMYLQLHRRPLTHLNVAQVAVYARHRCQQQGEQFHFLSLHLAVLLKQHPRARFISQVN